MKNRLFSLFVFALFSTMSFAYGFEVDKLYYTKLSNNEVSVSKSYSQKSVIEIPSKVEYNGEEYSVTKIESSTFWGCSSLECVEIPSSVTSIGNYAFCNCSSLASVTIPSSVTKIESSTFSG